MPYSFGARSQANLEGVHPDLVKVVTRALELSSCDFSVIEGVRTLQKQKEYFARGASKTMASRHLATKCKAGVYGHAVDLYPVGKPTPWHKCKDISEAMFKASKELMIPIRWGGDWNMNGSSEDEKFYDGPHFELLRTFYP
jgi:peptidoglycan L-alanyl-D-glutamate endopeptidase CwlK